MRAADQDPSEGEGEILRVAGVCGLPGGLRLPGRRRCPGARRLARRSPGAPRLDYRVVEGAGHFLMLDKPAEFHETLSNFLRENGLLKP